MNRTAICTWAAMLALFAGTGAGGLTDAIGPATAAAATTQPAAKDEHKADAEKHNDTDEERDKSTEATIRAANRSFVVVRTWYRKDMSEAASQTERNWQTTRLYGEYIDKKRPAEVPGLVLDDRGGVLIADDGIEDRFIEKIEVRDVAGKIYPARRAKLLLDAPGIVLKADRAAGSLKPPEFVALEKTGIDTKLLQARLWRVDDKWRVQVSPLYPSVEYARGKVGNVFFGYRSSSGSSRRIPLSLPVLIADDLGRPVGCAAAPYLDLAQTECLWKGADLARGKARAWDEFAADVAASRKKLIAATQEIVIKFHQGGDEGSRRYEYSERPSAAAGREISAYGAAISDTHILVPTPLDRRTAAQIDKIYVKHSPTNRQAAEFVGAYKGFSAFVVRLSKGTLPAHVELAPADPPRMTPFLVANMRKKQGKKYVDLATGRIQGKARGYAGKYHWTIFGETRAGSLLVDFRGRLLGANLNQRIEHEEERQYQRSSRYYSPRSQIRVFTISELRGALTSPLAHMDAKIKVKTRVQAKRRTWLGVEYVPMTPPLAEELKVEAPTRDGQIGFIVNAVYAGSPAEKHGLKVGDILLKVQAPGMREPIELAGRLDRYRSSGYGQWFPGGGLQEGGGPLPPTWKKRENVLTRMLDAIGADKVLKLTYHRPGKAPKGKTVTLDYKIQQAPPDFQSARKWQNRKLGLTVKDVTYEIRHALNLTGPTPGVIVAKTERGSPVEVARIFINEIVTRMDDKPLRSAREMRDRVAAARKAGRDKVRLTILRLGKTRFADLAIGVYDPADDEGLDEQ